jgi:hypothetical protein
MVRFRILSESPDGERHLLFILTVDNVEIGREEALRAYGVHAKRLAARNVLYRLILIEEWVQ